MLRPGQIGDLCDLCICGESDRCARVRSVHLRRIRSPITHRSEDRKRGGPITLERYASGWKSVVPGSIAFLPSFITILLPILSYKRIAFVECLNLPVYSDGSIREMLLHLWY